MKDPFPSATLPDTAPLTWSDDLSGKMNAGLHEYLDRKTRESASFRDSLWKHGSPSNHDTEAFRAGERQRLARLIGLVEERLPPQLISFMQVGAEPELAETESYRIEAVRWPVFAEITGEGLLLSPKGPVQARLVAVPDADQTPEDLVGLTDRVPESSQFPRHLAEVGCQVVVVCLLSRESTYSRSELIEQTNQPHREWIYRQAYPLGRHPIGLEVQKLLSLVDWFTEEERGKARIGMAGYGEGALLAFYAAALDCRIGSVLVSGYFGPREDLWRQPVYRNVWGLLREFGDAEIASLIAPRGLVIEYAPEPEVEIPVPEEYHPQKHTAVPGRLRTPFFREVADEFERLRRRYGREGEWKPHLISAPGEAPVPFGSRAALEAFLNALELRISPPLRLQPLAVGPAPRPRIPSAQERQVRQMERYLQRLARRSDRIREEAFFKQVDCSSVETFVRDTGELKSYLWEELLGRLDDPVPDPNPRSRRIYDTEHWCGYDVVLDLWEEACVWGILCVPKDLSPGERRPVVVCQHGWEGTPTDTIENTPRWGATYNQFTARLADRGFVTLAVHNPYWGGYRFLQLERKAQPLKATLGSIIAAEHLQFLRWLSTLPFVDPDRIGFYGISYGGWTANRIPPLLDQYCLAICSACFNDWIRKVTNVDDAPGSYMQNVAFNMAEWDSAHTFSNAEMAYLMIPRPFMVERGMHDPVAPDSWVAYEYAKVQWLYWQLGLPERTRIEFFNGGHVIHGQGAFAFLHQHLDWPEPSESSASTFTTNATTRDSGTESSM